MIVGSVRVQRFAPVVTDWFVERARARGEFDTAVLDLADASLPQDLSRTREVDDFTERIGNADAFVVVTSEYNHGYPAALKTALDTVKYEWRAKPVGFVAYGGMSGGLRAVEQMRQVVAELHMVSVRESRQFPSGAQALRPGGRRCERCRRADAHTVGVVGGCATHAARARALSGLSLSARRRAVTGADVRGRRSRTRSSRAPGRCCGLPS